MFDCLRLPIFGLDRLIDERGSVAQLVCGREILGSTARSNASSRDTIAADFLAIIQHFSRVSVRVNNVSAYFSKRQICYQASFMLKVAYDELQSRVP